MEAIERKNSLVVSVCMITYGHELYIKAAIDGVLMQECDFALELIIADDCSPDNTQKVVEDIIKNHPAGGVLKYTRHYKNKGMIDNFLWALSQCKGKYIALCEGDDYWTDPLKLQKQVEVLENNKEVVAVATNSSVANFEGDVLHKDRLVVPENREGTYNLHEFFKDAHQYPTLTVMFRKAAQEKIREKLSILANPFLGDWTLWVMLHTQGDFYFLNKVTATYRLNPASVTHTANAVDRWKEDFIIRRKLMKILPDEYRKYLEDDAFAYFNISMAYRKQKKYTKFLFYQIRSFFSSPKFYISHIRKLTKR